MPQGLLNKIIGKKKDRPYPLSDKTAQEWPELEQVLASLAINEMPNEIGMVDSIKPKGILGKVFGRGMMGNYNPITNNIALDRSLSGQELSDTLMHELVHARQRNQSGSGILQTIFGNKNEQERQAEGTVIKRKPQMIAPRTDINLPLLKGQKIDPRIKKENEFIKNTPSKEKWFNIVANKRIQDREKSLVHEAALLEKLGPSYANEMLGNKNYGKDINLPLLDGQRKDPRLLKKVYSGK